jgi:hypothetical protein
MLAYLLTFLGALVIVLLGSVVYRRHRASPVHQTFAWLMSATALWMTTAFLSQRVADPVTALILVRLAFVAASAIALFLLLFAAVFPNGTRAVYTKRFWWTDWGVGLTLMALSGSPLMVSNVTLFPWGANVVPGPLYLLFPVYFLMCVGVSLWRLFRRWQQSRGRVRQQIAYLLTGFVLTALLGSWTNLILPLVSGINPYAQYGPLSSLFVAGFTGYAMLAYRLFDIRRLAGKTLVTLGLLLFVWGVYAMMVALLPELLASGRTSSAPDAYTRIAVALSGLLVALGFAPLKAWLERAVERMLFPHTRAKRVRTQERAVFRQG